MNCSDYLKLLLALLFLIVSFVVPVYLVRLFLRTTAIEEMILISILVIAWMLFVPWNLPIEEWIGNFVKKYMDK